MTAHTIVEVQHQQWTVVISLRRHGHNLLSRNTVTWRPARGTCQHRPPATPPMLFPSNPAIYFPEVDKTCVCVFGRLPGFIENLLESANLFCNAAGATQTALGVRQLCFNFFALSFFNKFGIHSSWEAEQRDTPVVGAFTPVSLVVYGEWGWSIYQSFDALPKRHDTWHQGCSEAGTRGNGVPTPFSCFDLKVLLALHPCLTHAISQTIRRSKFS